MSDEPNRRDRSLDGQIAMREAQVAKKESAAQKERDRLQALKDLKKIKAKGPETRDKVLIGVAALAAVEKDMTLAYSIDAAIAGLQRREQEHLARDESLWRKTWAKVDNAQPTDALQPPAPASAVAPIKEAAGHDDPDMAPMVFQPDPKNQWAWYDDWKDHGSVFTAMGMTRNKHAMWLAKSYRQQKGLEVLGRQADLRLGGLNEEECLDRIAEIAEQEAQTMTDEATSSKTTKADLETKYGQRRSRKNFQETPLKP